MQEDAVKKALLAIQQSAEKIESEIVQKLDDFAYLRDRLSPEGNDACILLSRLRVALFTTKRGEIPPVWLTDWHTASMHLIEVLKRSFIMLPTLHYTWNAQKGLYDLLTERYIEYDTDEGYRAEISVKIDALKNLYRQNSNGFHNLLMEQEQMKKARVKGKVRRTNKKNIARHHREDEVVFKEIIRRYLVSRQGSRKGLSYRKIVEQMKGEGATYSARMRGKSVSTWANQASAFAVKVRDTEG